ncbi:MAG: ABC transporter ATP-binding protein/permease, partial [Anaerolineales bacterium]|nr:ABC transporter ATP-binding protein/permease [Anaerolineales bacterium]
QASEFIFTKEEGLSAEISQAGANVSGGQKQRLAIARALVKKPPVYIFDDSFSALDFKTDSALRKALKQKTADSTVLIVTQRVATVKNADQIIVLDEGRVVGKGKHQELMDSCETYQEIAFSQLSKGELE